MEAEDTVVGDTALAACGEQAARRTSPRAALDQSIDTVSLSSDGEEHKSSQPDTSTAAESTGDEEMATEEEEEQTADELGSAMKLNVSGSTTEDEEGADLSDYSVQWCAELYERAIEKILLESKTGARSMTACRSEDTLLGFDETQGDAEMGPPFPSEDKTDSTGPASKKLKLSLSSPQPPKSRTPTPGPLLKTPRRSPSVKTATPTSSPAHKAPTPAASPANESATSATSPANKPPTPLISPAHKSASPMASPANRSASSRASPAAKSATPASSPAYKSDTPSSSPAHKTPRHKQKDKETDKQNDEDKQRRGDKTDYKKDGKKDNKKDDKKVEKNTQAKVEPTDASEPDGKHVVGDAEESTDASTTENAAKKRTTQDPYFRKPFEYGWKRELVWRANYDSVRDKADVYFITPKGKKLRGRSDIIPLLEGDLTIDHFCFTREPLDAGPEFESIRYAKSHGRVSSAAATLAAAPPTPNIGKRISKPKAPKGASPPPQGWTATKALKVNNAALHTHPGQKSSPSTPVVATASSRSSSSVRSSKSKRVSSSSSQRQSSLSLDNPPPTPNTSSDGGGAHTAHEPCTINCPRAEGQVPMLECETCRCLCHRECASDVSTSAASGPKYICEACKLKQEPPLPQAQKPKTVPVSQAPLKTPVPFPHGPLQHSVVVVKSKKYLMITKPKPKAAPANDIENDVKQINDGLRNKSNNTPTPTAVMVPQIVESTVNPFAANLFSNVSMGYAALLNIMRYLKIHERTRAASVCKLWNLASKDTSLWATVRMKNAKVYDWAGFTAALRRGETKHLDLRKMLPTNTHSRGDDMWQGFVEHIGTVCSLEQIDMCKCSSRIIESLCKSNKNLRVLNALSINGDYINIAPLSAMRKLEELRLRTVDSVLMQGSDLTVLMGLTNIVHLQLTTIKDLGDKRIEGLRKLTELRSLELGECNNFDETFAVTVLPRMKNLQRLRLENQESSCCALTILEAVARLEQLTQLELVNFDIKLGFTEALQKCTSIRKLLVIPTYLSQSATTNHIILSAVQKVAPWLRVFTWGVTLELLRVTALYVDQCEESTKKEKRHFDECIPVLKPVPGARPKAEVENEDDEQSEVPQIEILPLDKVEVILADSLPNTKFKIIKVPYHATSKQQIVEQ